jgi:hypothetical protein
MCKRLNCLIAFIVMLALAGNTSASLLVHWRLDEGSGITAYDSSGNGNDGTFTGEPQWVDGYNSAGALQFDGVDDYVVYSLGQVETFATLSVAFWVKADTLGQPVYCSPFSSHYPNTAGFQVDVDGGNPGNYRINPNSGNQFAFGTVTTDWIHLALTIEGNSMNLYYNGIWASSNTLVDTDVVFNQFAIAVNRNRNWWFAGTIDDLRVYDHVLSDAEILSTMSGEPWPYAFGPDPADGALHEATWVTLSWMPGQLAVSHDVYLGDDLDVVDGATRDSEVFRGNQTTTFHVAGFPGFAYPGGLVAGTTYYWRVDEVNEANSDSPWKGDVWSFSIPPKTAYNPNPPDGDEVADANSVTLSWTNGFGAILHTVYFGDDFDEVNNATVGIPAGTTSFSPGKLEREKVYYWRVDEFDAMATHKGDVWTFTTPGAVGTPQPTNGAADVGMDAALSWMPADSAASHQLYLGTDKAAVRNADTGASEYKGSIALGAETHDPGLLEANTTYYWRVDEVDDQGNTAKGPLWIFTTGAFLLVDDFERYTDNDVDGEAIWQTWIDGFGVADNGAQVGYLVPPYCEQTIVHGGAQSMPLLYVNEAGVSNSEASLTLTTLRDWTQAGVSELSLWFRGASVNAAAPLYVAISNSAGSPAVVAHNDSDAATGGAWREWRISLSAFADQGINLSNVDKIAIGLGSKSGMASAGGSGTMFIDDIRLYRQ